MNDLAKEITNWREDMGFYTPVSLGTTVERDYMLGKLMLVTSEVSEAAEAVRLGNKDHFEEELADTIIRVLDICGAMGIDIDKVVKNKMEVNKERLFRHGKSTSL